MGKKNPATIRAMRAARETEALGLANAHSKRIQAVPDNSLFSLDTTGSAPSRTRRREAPEPAPYASASVTDRAVTKLLKTHTPKTLVKIASSAASKIPKSFNQSHKTKKVAKSADVTPKVDLWDADFTPKEHVKSKFVNRGGSTPGVSIAEVKKPEITSRTDGERYSRDTRVRDIKEKKKNRVAVDVAHQGQSYNPDFGAHQEMLGAAVAVEYKRKEVVEDERTPLQNQGMSEETLAVLNQEDSDSDNSDNDEEDEDARYSVQPVIKRTKKLSKTDRNRQKRHREKEVEVRKRKEEKQFMNQILEAKKLKKSVGAEERIKEETRKEKKRLRDEKEAAPIGIGLEEMDAVRNPKKARSLAVALSSEVGGGLRSVVSKSSLLKDRQLSLSARGTLSLKNTRERKIKEGKKRRDFMKKQEKYIF
jgi:hypothetical protein